MRLYTLVDNKNIWHTNLLPISPLGAVAYNELLLLDSPAYIILSSDGKSAGLDSPNGMVEDEDPDLEAEDALECVLMTSRFDEFISPLTVK